MALVAYQPPAEVHSSSTLRDLATSSAHIAPRRKQAPEERLMIAVLHDALDCLEKYRFDTGRAGRRLFQQARRWFLADEPEWPYSFACICEVLDLDPNDVRLRLTRRAVTLRTSRCNNGG